MGTRESVIIEILASRTKAQIKEIIKAYKEGKCLRLRFLWSEHNRNVLPASTVSKKMAFLKAFNSKSRVTLLSAGKQNVAMLREFENPFLGLHPAAAKGQQISNFVQFGYRVLSEHKQNYSCALGFSPHYIDGNLSNTY